jgi:hypothetical protein
MEGDERGGSWRALNPTRTLRGEEADETGWKVARRGCFCGGRRRVTCEGNRIRWLAAGSWLASLLVRLGYGLMRAYDGCKSAI